MSTPRTFGGRVKLAAQAFMGLLDTPSTNPSQIGKYPYMHADTNQDFDIIVPEFARHETIAFARKIYANYAPIKSACHDKATYAVGRSWEAVFLGEDKDWGEQAAAWLRDEWYGVADVTGKDYVTGLWLGSVAIDRDGAFGTLLTKTADGYPQIQRISSHRIGGRFTGEVKEGPYKGLKAINGVILNAVGRPVAYRVWTGNGAADYRDVSARDFIYTYDPEWFEQYLGMPSFSHAINSSRAAMDAQGWEETAHQIGSREALIEYNERGGADPNDPANLGNDGGVGGNGQGIQFQRLAGGSVRYFKANTGSKLEMFRSDRPADSWERFQDRMVRLALSGMGWPTELVWKGSDLGSPAVRMRIGQAMRAVADRQDVLYPGARREVAYAIACAINLGILPPNKDWWKWGFTLPAKLSVDAGRDSNNAREDYIIGHRNLTDILGEQGRSLRPHLEQRAMEEVMIDEVAKKYNIPRERIVDKQTKQIVTPAQQEKKP